MYAASGGVHEIIPDLLAAGADPHFRDGDGDTPLSIAKDYPAVIEALRTNGRS